MKDHNQNNRVDALDTLKNIPKNPTEAIKDDYEQTKADMKKVRDETGEKINEAKDDAEEEGVYRP